jgi:alkylation response protein AidB-like acyl-CoA dehydrogenase
MTRGHPTGTWPRLARAAAGQDAGENLTVASAKAKLFASEIAVRVADCVKIHDGYGFVKDYPGERYFRDSC